MGSCNQNPPDVDTHSESSEEYMAYKINGLTQITEEQKKACCILIHGETLIL